MSIQKYDYSGVLAATDITEWVSYNDHIAEVERAFTAGYQSAPVEVIDTNAAEVMRQACIEAVEEMLTAPVDKPKSIPLRDILAALREVQP